MRGGVRGLAGLREPAAPALRGLHLPRRRPCRVVARRGRRSPFGARAPPALRRPPDRRDRCPGHRDPMTTPETETRMQPDTIDPTAYARRWKTLAVLSLS